MDLGLLERAIIEAYGLLFNLIAYVEPILTVRYAVWHTIALACHAMVCTLCNRMQHTFLWLLQFKLVLMSLAS